MVEIFEPCHMKIALSHFWIPDIDHNMKYHVYPKYWDTLTLIPYYACPKLEQVHFTYLLICLKTDGWGANSVDPDQMPHVAASDLGLHCLPYIQ